VRIAAADAGIPVAIFSWLVASSIAGLGGCALSGGAADYRHVKSTSIARSSIPLPSEALLTPQPEPGCALKRAATEERPDKPPGFSSSPTGPGAAPQPSRTPLLGQLVKLEYERNCFQKAEWRVRNRLRQLQAAVAKTMKAAKGISQNTSGP
jgi:hypothetical protein